MTDWRDLLVFLALMAVFIGGTLFGLHSCSRPARDPMLEAIGEDLRESKSGWGFSLPPGFCAYDRPNRWVEIKPCPPERPLAIGPTPLSGFHR